MEYLKCLTTNLPSTKLRDSLGAETLLDNLVQALTADEQRENFDYIARCFDIDLSDCESEA
jgi:hypothetical protein